MVKVKEKNRFQHLLEVTSSHKFLTNEGVDEIPFYIQEYNPQDHQELNKEKELLKKNLSQKDIRVLEINLYDLAVKILKDNGDWDWYIEKEPELTKQEFKEELQGILDVEQVLTPAISEIIKESEHEIVFLTGIGEVFPYIRSHSVLSNLQVVAKHKPTIIFFPGGYQHSLDKGASLKLFNLLADDKYYRAFNIEEYEV
jgi:hypothetical protein